MRKSHSKEEHVKADVKELLKKHGVWYFMPIGGPFATVGIPDFIACVAGELWGIETKFGSNKPTQMQAKQLHDITAAGGRSFVITEKNIDVLAGALERAMRNVGTAGEA
jgi:hypothetical protein